MSRRKRSRQNTDISDTSTDYLPDTFLPTVLANEETVCIMCKQGYEHGLMMTKKMKNLKDFYEIESCETTLEERFGLDPQGVWASLYPLDTSTMHTKHIWVHFVCAMYSPLTWLKSNRWHNLKSEIRRSQQLECCVCKKRGATVGCVIPRCNYIIHVSCAISLGWSPTILRKRFACPCHEAKTMAADKEADQLYAHDISKGQEAVQVTMESSTSTTTTSSSSSPSLMTAVSSSELFKYIKQNVDSDETESNVINTNNLPYCDCDNNCSSSNNDTISPCQCCERSETIAEQLHINPRYVVTECGMRCECSISTCCRRIIGRGLSWNLHIFIHSNNKRSNFLLLDEEISESDAFLPIPYDDDSHETIAYGVRTKDFIPSGKFICEIVGQYLKTDSSSADSSASTESDDEKIFSITKWITDCKRQDNSSHSQLLNGNSTQETSQIQLDCRVYRNVGSFIRQTDDHTMVNVIRKIAFIDQINLSYPRLVLYAARDIEGGEEILLAK